MEKVIMRIYPGGGWEGMVCYEATHPTDHSIQHVSNNYDEIKHFCGRHNLAEDLEYKSLVLEKLVLESNGSGKGTLIIPLEHIEEHAFYTSASKFLKTHFGEYSGSFR